MDTIRAYQVYGADWPNELRIIGDLWLPIHHSALVRKMGRKSKSFTRVFSHQQALDQCRTYIGLQALAVGGITSSTAEAARLVASDAKYSDAIAIASPFASRMYRLRRIQDSIETSYTNATRFHLISSYLCRNQMRPNRTAIIFSPPAAVGSLARIIDCISKRAFNISSIHSIASGVRGVYSFYCEFDYHSEDIFVPRLLQEMSNIAEKITILGSYPRNGL